MAIAWRIFYTDGMIFDSGQGRPADAPGYGVEVIVQPDPTPGIGNVSYVCLAGYDWYYWRTDDEEWAGAAGDASIWDLILHREPIVGICQGRRVSRERYHRLLDEAAEWAKAQGLPTKNTFQVGERAR